MAVFRSLQVNQVRLKSLMAVFWPLQFRQFSLMAVFRSLQVSQVRLKSLMADFESFQVSQVRLKASWLVCGSF